MKPDWYQVHSLDVHQMVARLCFAIPARGRHCSAGSSHACSITRDSFPVLQLGTDMAVASSHVRLLGVEISSDLELVHHVSRISSGCYYRLRQLRRIRRSLDSWVGDYTRLCLRPLADWLLQYCSCRCTKNSHRQIAALVEHCCACY